MISGKRPAARKQRWEISVPELYTALPKQQMLGLGGDLLALHYGLWGRTRPAIGRLWCAPTEP